jgi:hypothetical protein
MVPKWVVAAEKYLPIGCEGLIRSLSTSAGTTYCFISYQVGALAL